MAILFVSETDDGKAWKSMLEERIAGADVRIWPDCGNINDITMAVVWKPAFGLLASLPNLIFIHSLGAGVDFLFEDKNFPDHIPLCRLVDDSLTRGMSEFVLYQVLKYHRNFNQYAADQIDCRWSPLPQIAAAKYRVGILGLGQLGRDAAKRLIDLGYDVAGWARGKKQLPGLHSFYGQDQLDRFLRRCDCLVCLLPLTAQTRGILDKNLFTALPRGAVLVNPARGGHLVDKDLIEALDSGHLSAAALDVFHNEPLSPEHPFWHHEKIDITPHIASLTLPETAADVIADNILRFQSGQPLKNRVDLAQGY